VIAIENVRLFQELQARNRELGRPVEELKALGEVGQAVSSTLDLQTVLSTIVRHAVHLSGTDCGIIYEYDEPTEEFHLRASYRDQQQFVPSSERVSPGLWPTPSIAASPCLFDIQRSSPQLLRRMHRSLDEARHGFLISSLKCAE
jgi:GAF domain-containing protein